MPVLLLPSVVPRQALVTLRRQSLRQRLHRLSLRIAGRLLTAWRALFAETRQALEADVLRETLRAGHLLDAEAYVMGQWRQEAEQPARLLLPALMADVLQQTAALTEDERHDVAGVPFPVLLLPETQHEMERYAGGQITALTGTTLLGLRYLLRGGRGGSEAAQAQRVMQRFGLTPSQVQSLDQAEERWRQEGRSAAQVQDGVEQATAKGLTQRLRQIAQTQGFGAVNLAQRLGMTQAAQTGPQGTAGVRRYWYLGPRPCDICVQIPGMNPQGRALDEGFMTPVGIVHDPPIHPSCMCGADYAQRG